VGKEAEDTTGFPLLQPGLPGLRVTVISNLYRMKTDSEKTYRLIFRVRDARVKGGSQLFMIGFASVSF